MSSDPHGGSADPKKPPRFSYTVLDFSSADFVRAVDVDPNDTTITDLSKPANPQITHTVTADEIPDNTNNDVDEFNSIFSVGGKNNNGSTARTLSYRFTLNGVEVGSSDSTISVTASRFYVIGFKFATLALQAGDVLGVKLWCTTSATDLDYQVGVIYIFPKKYRILKENEFWLVGESTVFNLEGSIVGVAYGQSQNLASAYRLMYLDTGAGPTVTVSTSSALWYALPYSNVELNLSNGSDGTLTASGNITILTLYRIASVAISIIKAVLV